jgi:uncharacterized hydrophobic protein (TIGR00271 family)
MRNEASDVGQRRSVFLCYGCIGIPTITYERVTMSNRAALEKMQSLMRENSRPSATFLLLMFLSGTIAALGLIIDSAPAIIGAMIIAPLMSPIISLAYGLANLEVRTIATSTLSILVGVSIVVAVSAILTMFVGSRLAGHEILSRTEPTLIDFGIALAAGCAAAFAHSKTSIQNSIAGVAVAVSLVPPLAVSGIGYALGGDATDVGGMLVSGVGASQHETDIASGAFFLFLTNLLGILAIAAVVFLVQGYGSPRRSALVYILLAAVIWAATRPLEREFHEFYVTNRVVALVSEAQHGAGGEQFIRVERVRSDVRDGTVYIHADLQATESFFKNTETDLDEFTRQLSEEIGEPVELYIDVIPVDVRRFQSSSRQVNEPPNE